MTFYTDLRSAAEIMVTEYGQAVTLKRIAAGAYDPSTGTAAQTVTSYPGRAIMGNYSNRDIDGTLIMRGDRLATLACDTLGVVPSKDDVLTVDGVDWTVQSVEPVDPGGVALIYRLQVRK